MIYCHVMASADFIALSERISHDPFHRGPVGRRHRRESKGIGKGIARVFAGSGGQGRHPGARAWTQAEAAARGDRRASALAADVTDEAR